MRDHSSHKAASRHEAVNALLKAWSFAREDEVVPVLDAANRVCARTMTSQTMLPNWPTSNMDAVAVRYEDFKNGIPSTDSWQRGIDWQFCNTGVAMPKGFDTAIRIEDVQVSEDNSRVSFSRCPERKGESVTNPGAALQQGDLLAEKGQVLTPTLLSVLSMGGYTEVPVVRKPKVMFIPTGNELVTASPLVPEGKNIDSNSALIGSKINLWGGEAICHPIVPDNPDQILAALTTATEQADIVVINAGSSKGSDDYTCELLEEKGTVLFHEVTQGPGRHCSFSLLNDKPVIGISGPPVGAEFTCDFFVKPFIDIYLGADTSFPPKVRCRMLDACPAAPRSVTIVRRVAVRRTASNEFVAFSVALDQRPILRKANEANGLVSIPPDGFGWKEGNMVDVELRWPYTLPPLL